LESSGSAARAVLLTVASSSDRFDFHLAALDPLAALANPHANTLGNKDEVKRIVLNFILKEKRMCEMNDGTSSRELAEQQREI
jgi:hypothetical protein